MIKAISDESNGKENIKISDDMRIVISQIKYGPQ